MSARGGGLFIGGFEALDLYPGASMDFAPVGSSGAELRRRMQRCAFVVLPCLSDSAEPQALVMAFAEGLPVIASRLPVSVDLVEPGRNGLLFEPGSARELARRLAWAGAFPEKMRQMGECAQADYRARLVAHWNWRRLYGERRRQARLHP